MAPYGAIFRFCRTKYRKFAIRTSRAKLSQSIEMLSAGLRFEGNARMQEDTKKKSSSKNAAKTQAKTPKKTERNSGAKAQTSRKTTSKSESATSAKTKRADKRTSKSAERASSIPSSVRPKTKSNGYVIAAVLIILGAILFLMLFTFSATDLLPETEQKMNLFGYIGALISNILLTLFGTASFFFPAICLFKGLTTFCARPLDVKPSELVGLTIILIASTPLLTVLMDGVQLLDHTPGGALGTFIAQLALQHISLPVLEISGAVLSLIGLLLVTDTSLKTFFLGIFKCIRAIFRGIGKLLTAPIEAYKNRPLKNETGAEPTPENVPDPLDDPLSEESTDELLGAPSLTEMPSNSAQNEVLTSNAAPTQTPNSVVVKEDEPPSNELPHDIVDKLDDDEAIEEENDDEAEDSEPQEEKKPEDGIAAILAKVIPGKAKMRSTRRDASVPAVESKFSFDDIVTPEQLALQEAGIQPQTNEQPEQVEATAPTGVLGNWKPRNIGKKAVLTDKAASSASPLSGDNKTFQPEAVMETLAQVPASEAPFHKSQNITNDILAQCDESMSLDNFGQHTAEKKADNKNIEQPAERAKAAPKSAEQKTGCVASGELAALVSGSKPKPVPTDEEIQAFFKNTSQPNPAALQNIMNDFKPSQNSVRAQARDIMQHTRNGSANETNEPTKSFSVDDAILRDRPTRAISLNDIGSPSSDKSTREAAAVKFSASEKQPNVHEAKTGEYASQPRTAEHATRMAPAIQPQLSDSLWDDIGDEDDMIKDLQDYSDEMQKISVAPTPNEDSLKTGGISEEDSDALARLMKNLMHNSAQPSQASEKPFKVPMIENHPIMPQSAHTAGFVVAETRKRCSEDDINEAERERQSTENKYEQYKKPSLALLNYNATTQKGYSQDELEVIAKRIEDKFAEFKLSGQITHICPGPVVTRFEFKPAPGIKVARFSDLAHDLMMALEIVSVRILAPIPGKGVVGIEIPNEHRNTIYLKEVLASEAFVHNKSVLTMALGQDTEGTPFITNLAKMPHILVAGTTGSGKSVGINTMLCSILYNATPNEVKLILVDPKCLELSIYAGIPHLLTPPITTAKETSAALDWACEEMERRYRLLQDIGVRNIENYNETLKKAEEAPEELDPSVLSNIRQQNDDGTPKHKRLTYLVIVIDEFADLMMVARKEIETQVARLAQKARAAGINMILATQRPSTNVITGVIKANFPARLAFKVQGVVDSGTILGHKGAEALLGRGDSIFQDPSTGLETRVHGCFVSDDEVLKIVKYLCTQGKPEYDDSITAPKGGGDDAGESRVDAPAAGGHGIQDDPVYQRAIEVIRRTGKASTSSLQRELGIGFPKAGKIIDQMEKDGLIGPADSKHNREIYI